MQNSREISPGFWGENLGVFWHFQAVINYKRVKNRQFSGTDFPKFREFPEIPRDKFVQFREIREFRPKKTVFFTEYALRSRVPSGKFGSFLVFFRTLFFPKMHKFVKKVSKKCPKTPKKHPKKHPEIVRVFSRNYGCIDLLRCWKMVENFPRKIRVHTVCTLFFPRKSRGGKSGVFSDFQLKIRGVRGGKSGCFSTRFWKKKHFFYRFTGWRSMVPPVTWGENSHFDFLKMPNSQISENTQWYSPKNAHFFREKKVTHNSILPL
jgi:hypothetical protein